MYEMAGEWQVMTIIDRNIEITVFDKEEDAYMYYKSKKGLKQMSRTLMRTEIEISAKELFEELISLRIKEDDRKELIWLKADLAKRYDKGG